MGRNYQWGIICRLRGEQSEAAGWGDLRQTQLPFVFAEVAPHPLRCGDLPLKGEVKPATLQATPGKSAVVFSVVYLAGALESAGTK
ncbi:hypothetical protein ASC96_22440 [Rhizobium sp. Root1204]|nr:hypothetical protein ASC96_22440 [Rhizobium sp. Root1204]